MSLGRSGSRVRGTDKKWLMLKRQGWGRHRSGLERWAARQQVVEDLGEHSGS